MCNTIKIFTVEMLHLSERESINFLEVIEIEKDIKVIVTKRIFPTIK